MFRLLSSDQKRQILIQGNFLTYHWVRQDFEPTGHYPGFSEIFEEFSKIFESIHDIARSNGIDFASDIDYFYLAYNDRINVTPFIMEGKKLSDVINAPGINFTVGNKVYESNNTISTHTTICEYVNGYIITSLNSPTVAGEQMLIIENKIDGIFENKTDISGWFEKAHEVQLSIFENLINVNVLETWL